MTAKKVDTWISELNDLPNDSYEWVTQVAHELAEGVTKGFWMTLIATEVSSGWIPHIGLREYVDFRESQAPFDGASTPYGGQAFGVIVESLVLAGYCERTRRSSGNIAWLTPNAFELLEPGRGGEEDDD